MVQCCIRYFSLERAIINDGALMPALALRNFATWNIEGFSFDKLTVLEYYMRLYEIDVLCIQETHTTDKEHFITQNGSLVILSGSSSEKFAGVGFIIAAAMRKAVHSFDCFNARMAAVKIRIGGGKMAFISTYTPQSDYAVDKRIAYFSQLEEFYASISVNGEKIMCGDYNARLRCRFAGED